MNTLSIVGQMRVNTMQASFIESCGLTLRVYDGRSFAAPEQTLAQVRKKKGTDKHLYIAKNITIRNLEKKFEEKFGLKVQVAGSDNSYLCDDGLTLKAAIEKDRKKLIAKAVLETEKNNGEKRR